MTNDFEGFTVEQLLQIIPPGSVLEYRGDNGSASWRASSAAFRITADASTPGGAVAGLIRMLYSCIESRGIELAAGDR
jgi:hypothetical protein